MYDADINLQWTSLLCPKSQSHYSPEHSITSPIRNIYAFYFKHCLTVSFRFSSIFVISSCQFKDLFWSIKMKNCWDLQSAFTSMADAFCSCKYVQSAREQGQKHRYNHGDFCCTAPTISFLQRELVQTTATAFFSTLLVTSLQHCQVTFKLSDKHDIL